MMHRVALLMPVLDAVDQYIDNLEQAEGLEEQIADHLVDEPFPAEVQGGETVGSKS
jgi:hypothetical protein